MCSSLSSLLSFPNLTICLFLCGYVSVCAVSMQRVRAYKFMHVVYICLYVCLRSWWCLCVSMWKMAIALVWHCVNVVVIFLLIHTQMYGKCDDVNVRIEEIESSLLVTVEIVFIVIWWKTHQMSLLKIRIDFEVGKWIWFQKTVFYEYSEFAKYEEKVLQRELIQHILKFS